METVSELFSIRRDENAVDPRHSGRLGRRNLGAKFPIARGDLNSEYARTRRGLLKTRNIYESPICAEGERSFFRRYARQRNTCSAAKAINSKSLSIRMGETYCPSTKLPRTAYSDLQLDAGDLRDSPHADPAHSKPSPVQCLASA